MTQKTKPNLEWTRTGLPRRQFLQAASALGATTAVGLGTQAASAAGGTLKMRTYADIRSLDPAFSQGIVDEEIHASIYSKLIQFVPGSDWTWQLDAATMVEQVDDTHINFALRDDMGFNDGFGAMTAEDVKYSFERIIDPDLASSNGPDWAPLDHVDVTGERTGTIVLKNAFQPPVVYYPALYHGEYYVQSGYGVCRRKGFYRNPCRFWAIHAQVVGAKTKKPP